MQRWIEHSSNTSIINPTVLARARVLEVAVDLSLAVRPAPIVYVITCLDADLRREGISSDVRISCGGLNLSKLVVDGKSEQIAKKNQLKL